MRPVESWYREYTKALLYFAWKMLGSKEDAQDVVSEFWAKIIANPPELITKTFLYVSIKNRCLDFKEKKARTIVKLLPDLAEWEIEDKQIKGYMMDAELARILSKELDTLSKKQRLVFVKTFLGGMKSEEIAEKYKIPLQTVYNYRVSALKRLRTSKLIKNYL